MYSQRSHELQHPAARRQHRRPQRRHIDPEADAGLAAGEHCDVPRNRRRVRLLGRRRRRHALPLLERGGVDVDPQTREGCAAGGRCENGGGELEAEADEGGCGE